MRETTPRFALIALSVAFVALGLPFVLRLGIEADEAMLANGIYDHGAPLYSWKFAGFELPVMLLSYLGALKTWLFNPYFALWAPSPLSLRLPALLAGVGALWLFFTFVDRSAGRLAAWLATFLMATDPVFLLINCTDFGFVAIQFLLKLSAILLLLRFHRTGARGALAGAFFLFGVAMWDKAVFAWVLFGLTAAAVVVFPSEVWRCLTPRNLAVAAVAILLGSTPLLIYNLARPLETVRANANLAPDSALKKAVILWRTLDGSVLFGFFTAFVPGPHPGVPHSVLQRVVVHLAAWLRQPRHDWILLALAAAIPIGLLAKRARRPMLFGAVACLATWLPMALTAGAGRAVQHTILLWPFPAFILAVVLAQAPPRWAATAAGLLCLSNLAVTNQYLADLIQDGPAIRFSDAINPLKRYLQTSKAERIFIADWGFIEPLCLLTEGNLPVENALVGDPDALHRMVVGPSYLFVSHTQEYAFEPENRARLDDQARKEGFEEENVAAIPDRNGRTTFEVFRFRRIPSNPSTPF